jgi:hypothetical protein
MTTDAQALAIATHALPLEERPALHFALAVCRAETHFGDGWAAGEGQGVGSNNMGAVQVPPSLRGKIPSFEHLDSHDGTAATAYRTYFKIYPTPEAGFKDAAFEVLRRPGVREAVEAGNGRAAVEAMRAGGYFELAADKYAAKLAQNYDSFLRATGEPRLFTFSEPEPALNEASAAGGSGSGLDGFLLLLLGVGVALATDFLKPKPPTNSGGSR